MQQVVSTTEVAAILGIDDWRIRRLYEDGTLPEPTRLAGRRVIASDSLPAIIDALRARGWLPETDSADAAVQREAADA